MGEISLSLSLFSLFFFCLYQVAVALVTVELQQNKKEENKTLIYLTISYRHMPAFFDIFVVYACKTECMHSSIQQILLLLA